MFDAFSGIMEATPDEFFWAFHAPDLVNTFTTAAVIVGLIAHRSSLEWRVEKPDVLGACNSFAGRGWI